MPAEPVVPVRLPARPRLRAGQALDCYLEHLADANHLTPAQVVKTLRRSAGTTRYLMLAPTPQMLVELANLTGAAVSDLGAATLSRYDGNGFDLTGLDPQHQSSYRTAAARGWVPGHATQLCPTCLAVTGTWSLAWRLPVVTACTGHRAFLLARCPGCDRPFRDQRHSPLRRVGAATVCGNPTGPDPTRPCDQDLTTLIAPPADPVCLSTQTRIDTALAGRRVTVTGVEVAAGQYLDELRRLTVLLLHLAARPGAEHLAAWAPELAREAQARAGQRGPRWGLRPPDDPVLRGRALASADRVLTAPTVADAADQLTGWVELAPHGGDGPLGWLADRTVMTSTLTRLVIAALAPHRRMSHALDAHPRTAARSTRHVPQVIPSDVHAEYLAGAVDAGDQTVRVYASICLARLDPAVTTWAQAAQALDMPATIGVAAARACSARMLVDRGEWTTRLDGAAAALPRTDFRALENKIRDLDVTDEWFEDWVQRCRPFTQTRARRYALMWLWVHVAHAHLDLAPAWGGQSPRSKDRALYRQFETSLSEHQQSELAHAPERATPDVVAQHVERSASAR